MAQLSERGRIIRMARRMGVVHTRDLTRAGIHRQSLGRLVTEGVLERVGRGIYRQTVSQATEHHGLVLAAASFPHGVLCLLSALSFHGVGTQVPSEVWMALDRRARAPRAAPLNLHVVRFSGAAFTEGVETHRVEGRNLRVFGLAKTLADCFKYRNKIGLDVAVEALREALAQRLVIPSQIDRFAAICRVSRVMRPYVEALTA